MIRGLLLILVTGWVGCASSGPVSKDEIGSSRHRVQRPGQGTHLDEQIATLLAEDNRSQALRLCNDILFSSRSTGDREIANYWRAIILMQDEIEAGSFQNAIDVLGKNSKWWESKAKDEHVQTYKKLLALIQEQNNLVKGLQMQLKGTRDCETKSLNECQSSNQKLSDELAKLKIENNKLLKALIETEAR